MTLLLLITAFGFAAFAFLALNIAHGEESGHVQTAGAVILVFFVHNLFMLSYGGRLSSLHRFSVVLHFCFIQTALSSQHSLLARNLLMRPLTGLSATVVITLGLSLVGSICSLLSSPTGNCPAFPKLM